MKPANDDDGPVTQGQLVITRGPNSDVVLVFGGPVKSVGFTIPEAMVLAVGLLETCLQIISEASANREAERPN